MSSLAMSEEQTKVIEKTVEKERRKLFNFIRRRVAFQEDAEDILQDVFYQLVNMYDSIGSIDKVASWMYRVARNKITDAQRKKKAELLSDQTYGNDGEEILYLQDILPDLSNSTEDVLLRDLIWETIQEALNELPEEQRIVFVLHEFEEQSFKTIAQQLGVAENTLFSRKRYALLHLRNRLKKLHEEL